MWKLTPISKRIRHPRGPDGKEYAPGEVFEVQTQREYDFYTKPRLAKDAPEKERPGIRSAPAVERAAIEPSEVPEPEPQRYKRRDVRPEE